MAAVGDLRGYYKLLGVHRTASAEEIKAAFRERAKLYHPDGGGTGADDTRFRQLREAYETLRDPQRRLHYDAEGLAAERREELARRGRDQSFNGGRSSARAGARTAGLTSLTGDINSGLGLVMGALGLVLAVMLVALGVMWSRLDARDQTIAELSSRLQGALAQEADIRARYQAGSDRLDRAAGDAAQRSPLYRTEFVFPEGSADVEGGLRARIDASLSDLRRTIGGLAPGRDWLVLVEGHTGRAADADGLLIDAWELALLRVGTITELLIQRGIPAERVAVRFQAGFAPSDAEAAEPRAVELKLLCCFR